MKQLYTLNPDIKSSDELLDVYNKSIKTDNLLKDLCNILFVNPKPYVYYTIKRYIGTMVRACPYEDVVRYVYRFVTDTDKWSYNFPRKVEYKRKSRVEDILRIRKKRNMSPTELVMYE